MELNNNEHNMNGSKNVTNKNTSTNFGSNLKRKNPPGENNISAPTEKKQKIKNEAKTLDETKKQQYLSPKKKQELKKDTKIKTENGKQNKQKRQSGEEEKKHKEKLTKQIKPNSKDKDIEEKDKDKDENDKKKNKKEKEKNKDKDKDKDKEKEKSKQKKKEKEERKKEKDRANEEKMLKKQEREAKKKIKGPDIQPLSEINCYPFAKDKKKQKKDQKEKEKENKKEEEEEKKIRKKKEGSIEDSVVTKVYSLPIEQLHTIYKDKGTWENHKKILTITPIESRFQKRQAWKRKNKKKNDYCVWGEVDGFACVPPQYGISNFGPPEEDKRPHGSPIDVQCKLKLWGSEGAFNQEEVIGALSQHFVKNKCGGIVEVPTSSGKTLMMTYIATELLKTKTLIIAPMVSLHSQLVRRIQEYAPTAKVGVIHQNKWETEGMDIVVGMLHTLAGKDFHPNAFDEFGAIIFDEVDRIATKFFSRVLYRLAHIRYIIGMSATVERQDGMERLFPLFMGPVIFSAPLATKDSSKTSVQAVLYNDGIKDTICQRHDPTAPDCAAMQSRILCDEVRHQKVLQLLDKLYAQGRNVVVMAQGVSYGKRLVEDSAKRNSGMRMVHYKRSMKNLQKEFVDENIHRLLVGTYSIFAVGMDVGYLDTLILLTSRRTVTQAVGRLRSYSKFERKPLLIIDLVDNFGFFKSQYSARRRVYKKRNYMVLETISLNSKDGNEEAFLKNKDLGTFGKTNKDPFVLPELEQLGTVENREDTLHNYGFRAKSITNKNTKCNSEFTNTNKNKTKPKKDPFFDLSDSDSASD